MKNHFFESAIAAARQSPEAFAAEFTKEEADANVKEYGDKNYSYGDPLIHCLIRDRAISEKDLPALLSILVQHKVNLECTDGLGERPLACAASYNKLKTVNFLIEHKVEINDPRNPALCGVTILFNNPLTLDIVKTLVQHRANINIQDAFTMTPLYYAARNKNLEVMRYLISQGADLLLKYTYASGTQQRTALGAAYDNTISAKRCFKEDNEYVIHAQAGLNLLVNAAKDYLHHQGLSFTGNNQKLEIHFKTLINDMAGHFQAIYRESNSTQLKHLLEQEVLSPALTRTKEERQKQIHAICMGSRDQRSAIYQFFQKNDVRNLLPKILSYVREVTPHGQKRKNSI